MKKHLSVLNALLFTLFLVSACSQGSSSGGNNPAITGAVLFMGRVLDPTA